MGKVDLITIVALSLTFDILAITSSTVEVSNSFVFICNL